MSPTLRAAHIQFKMARKFLAHARTAPTASMRDEFVKMAMVARSLAKKHRSAA